MARLRRITLPDFGMPADMPRIPIEEYRGRLKQTFAAMEVWELDILAVYADREHSANLDFLTGFDPRFEEALLLLDKSGNLKLLAGNECLGYLPDRALGIEVERFPEFSLMGQPRSGARPLLSILKEFGIKKGTRVGCAGWKYFLDKDGLIPEGALEIPSYLVDAFEELCGSRKKVLNANPLFMAPDTGLRTVNSIHQIARFEYAACHTSTGVLNALKLIRPGVDERALERVFVSAGLPLSCHAMVSFGEKAKRGLSSPSDAKALSGEAFTLAFGLSGALNSRAGVIARGPHDLPNETRNTYPDFAFHYFDLVAAWYEAVRIGATGGAVFEAVESARNPEILDLALNPGHLLHLDEWLHSPFSEGCSVELRSGMAIQMDMIPVSKGPFCYINGEDGIVLADEKLRLAFMELHPNAWNRIKKRRDFMSENLGITLHESVLPLGNIPGFIPPYAMNLTETMTR